MAALKFFSVSWIPLQLYNIFQCLPSTSRLLFQHHFSLKSRISALICSIWFCFSFYNICSFFLICSNEAWSNILGFGPSPLDMVITAVVNRDPELMAVEHFFSDLTKIYPIHQFVIICSTIGKIFLKGTWKSVHWVYQPISGIVKASIVWGMKPILRFPFHIFSIRSNQLLGWTHYYLPN